MATPGGVVSISREDGGRVCPARQPITLAVVAHVTSLQVRQPSFNKTLAFPRRLRHL